MIFDIERWSDGAVIPVAAGHVETVEPCLLDEGQVAGGGTRIVLVSGRHLETRMAVDEVKKRWLSALRETR